MRNHHSGFTLIELLVVISIIGVLTGLLFPALSLVRNQTRKTATLQRIIQLGNACEAYRQQTRRYPAEQGVTWSAGVPTWTAGWPTGHREAISYQGLDTGSALGDLLARTVDLQVPGEALAKGDPIAGYKHLVDGWGHPLRYQRIDELAGGVLAARAAFWTAQSPPPALPGVPGQREGFIIYSMGTGVPLDARSPADPADDSSAEPGRYWTTATHLVYRRAGE
jgi:prepilin-type N-terminal cleavage/methylation domain-containing protein